MIESRLRLHDPEVLLSDDIHLRFLEMRQLGEPVAHFDSQGNRYWAVTTHRQVQQVARDTATFTTRHGLTLDTYSYESPDGAADRMLEMTSPPLHELLRAAIAPMYRRGEVEVRRRQLEADAMARVESAVSGPSFDLVRDVTDPITATTIFSLMGFPRSDWDELFLLSRTSQEQSFGPAFPRPPFGSEADAATIELLRYIKRIVGRGDYLPGGHLAQLRRVEVLGRTLSTEELVLNCLNILQGGNATTSHAAAGGILALVENPSARQLVADDPDLLTASVEEVVRWTTPARHFCRHVEVETCIGSTVIPAGEAMTIWLVSANRDERVFDDPGTFDVRRRGNRHLGFLNGPHLCLGKHLARLEIRVILNAFLPHLERLKSAGRPEKVFSNFINGYQSAPMTVGAAS